MELSEDEGDSSRSFWEHLNDTFFNDSSTTASSSSAFVFSDLPSGCITNIDFSGGGVGSCCVVTNQDNECTKKRGRSDASGMQAIKTCREKLRREKLNESFLDLKSALEPGKATRRIDKPAILGDAVRILNHLKSESQELKETNEKLLEEVKNLKAEKDELHEEKLVLKADKERMEQQIKTMAVSPPGFIQAHPAAYHAGPSKLAFYPGYGLMPMWQYLPPKTCETSHDHELRPTAA